MGLDMYFYARKTGFAAFDRRDKESGAEDRTDYPKDISPLGDYIERWNYRSKITQEEWQIGYFRKFNALHACIVGRFGDESRGWEDVKLAKENVEEILEDMKKVAENHDLAEDLLPTQEGFFFGCTDYDKWYFSNVEDGIEFFELVLKTLDFTKYDFVYRASY